MIDILITATRRSKILAKTLFSFKKNMLNNIDCNLIINIDPVGVEENNDEVKDTVEYLYKHFTFFQPHEPSFPKAFKRLWKWSDADYVLNLEDDWELLQPVDLLHMIHIMEFDPSLASLRLPWKSQDEESMKNWKYFFPWNGYYYKCPEELIRSVGFCGHPSLLRGEFVRNCAPLLSDNYNPEKQFHNRVNTPLMQEIDKWDFGVLRTEDRRPAIADIGRKWMVENGFNKKGNKSLFQEWEKTT